MLYDIDYVKLNHVPMMNIMHFFVCTCFRPTPPLMPIPQEGMTPLRQLIPIPPGIMGPVMVRTNCLLYLDW